MDFEVRSRLSMRIFNPALSSMNGDESDDEDEDEEMEEDSDAPFIHPALDGSPTEPMESGDVSGDSPARKSLLRKRKLRQQPEQSSSSSSSDATSEPSNMDTNSGEETMNGDKVKEVNANFISNSFHFFPADNYG